MHNSRRELFSTCQNADDEEKLPPRSFLQKKKNLTQSERFRRTACAAIGLYRIPLEFLPLTRFSFGVTWSRTSLFIFLSRSSRARFYDIPEGPFSFPRGANASYFPVVTPFAVSFDYRHETRRLFPETSRVFLFHPLNVCGTRVSIASLSQIIAFSSISLDRLVPI